jgi:predicted GNAT superfamily acetyltransferase
MQDSEIRPLTTLDELRAVENLQRQVWDAPSTVIYQHMLISIVRNGGSVIGALKDGQVIGFVISFLGMANPESDRPAMANLKLVSQRMAILPAYRGYGVGYELKLAQRRFAIKHGIRLITWTFDPLQSLNAYLNIRKLGAIVREYYHDYYGTEQSPLVTAESSDRVLAEWWVTNNRVEQRLSGKRPGLTLGQYLDANAAILNPTREGADDLPRPAETMHMPQSNVILVEIPADYERIVMRDRELARAWRSHCRDVLESVLLSGYAVTDFVHGTHGGRARSFYALSYGQYNETQYGRFSSN